MNKPLSMQSIKHVELQTFNVNASHLMLAEPGKLKEFFDHLGYECEAVEGGFHGPCPVCRKSFAFIGTINGRFHPIYWQCMSKANCASGKFRPNLLGLTRALVDGQSMGDAIKTIALFLGFSNSFDITNMSVPLATLSIEKPRSGFIRRPTGLL